MLLQFDKVSKSYGRTKALIDFSIDLTPGIYALLGPNGSGKSTLMNILTDNLKADGGTIRYSDGSREGEDVLKMGVRFREKLGFMPQYPGMHGSFTAERFLWYIATLKNVGGHLKGRARKDYIAARIEEILEAVELSDVAHRRIATFSGGMKQRLALAQAVLGDPQILILDEPTAGLDPKQRIAIRNYISRIALNKIVIIATHVVSDVEFIAKEAILLKKGVIVDRASPAALASKMQGKVFEVPASEQELSYFQQDFHVVNIANTEEGIRCRILSEAPPSEKAKPAVPTLEDYYLWVFDGNMKA